MGLRGNLWSPSWGHPAPNHGECHNYSEGGFRRGLGGLAFGALGTLGVRRFSASLVALGSLGIETARLHRYTVTPLHLGCGPTVHRYTATPLHRYTIKCNGAEQLPQPSRPPRLNILARRVVQPATEGTYKGFLFEKVPCRSLQSATEGTLGTSWGLDSCGTCHTPLRLTV